MKFQLTFKTPDATDAIEINYGDEEDIREAKSIVNHFLKYGEYITVEFCKENELVTARVLRAR